MQRREIGRALFGASLSSWALPVSGEPAGQFDGLLGGSLIDVEGLKVGHATLSSRPTGCTVILCEKGATAGVDVRGSAPGTRETDLLDPVNTVEKVEGVVLTGGSAYGLAAAGGVMRYLEERGSGFRVGPAGVVPIVPAAVLFDLGVGDFHIRPDADTGYRACLAANSTSVAEGNVGAGAGATVGKMFGNQFWMKSGVGTASLKLGTTGVVVAALVAVNAVGDIYHPERHTILAGARGADGKSFRKSIDAVLSGERVLAQPGRNTSIGVVATNAPLTKAHAKKVAQMAHDGFARTINPVHTMMDGDTIFALSTGTTAADVDTSAIGAAGAVVVAHAVARAVLSASGLPQFHLPAARDL